MAIGEGDEKSDVSASGQITPDKRAGWAFENIAGNLTVEVNQLNIGSLASFFALAGIDIQAGGTIIQKWKVELKMAK